MSPRCISVWAEWLWHAEVYKVPMCFILFNSPKDSKCLIKCSIIWYWYMYMLSVIDVNLSYQDKKYQYIDYYMQHRYFSLPFLQHGPIPHRIVNISLVFWSKLGRHKHLENSVTEIASMYLANFYCISCPDNSTC